MSEASPAPSSSGVYYSGSYWNNRPEVLDYLNRRATDDPATPWWQHLLAWRGRPFEKVLAFNCGNGWVERDLLEFGVARSAIGIDITEDLLTVARSEASRREMPIEYISADTNTFAYDELDGVDLVLNYAAGHHVARVDTVFRRLAKLLEANGGVFVAWDYTGPHRNQYPAAMWEAMNVVNDALPPDLRKRLTYPHLPTMLVTDPSEAVHSELILDTFERYFDLRHLRHLGGPIAYELLNFNAAFFDPARDTSAEVHRILEADAEFTAVDPRHRSLFSYVIATSKPVAHSAERLTAWTAEEDERERQADRTGGRYYPSTVIGALTERIEVLERAVETAIETAPSAPPPLSPPALWRRVLGRARREFRSGIERVRGRRGRPPPR